MHALLNDPALAHVMLRGTDQYPALDFAHCHS